MHIRLLVAYLLVLAVGAAAMTPPGVVPSSPSLATIQVARAEHSYKSKEDDAGSGGDEPVWSHSSGAKVPGRFKPNPSGYDSERIQRFWRHYSGAHVRPEDKPKRSKEAR